MRRLTDASAPGVAFRADAAGWALLPLRAFLGFTFVFAALQKLANRAFFSATDPSSIQAQLNAARAHSPIGSLLGPAQDHAVALGVLIALAELAVGIGTLLGLWSRLAAFGGMLISLSFFLTVSFNTWPYYYGSDIVFTFAWTALLIAGSGGVLSLDAVLARRAQAGAERAARATSAAQTPRPARRGSGAHAKAAARARAATHDRAGVIRSGTETLQRTETLKRRELMSKGLVTGVVALCGLAMAGVASAFGRSSPAGPAVPRLHRSAAPTTTGPAPPTGPATSSTTARPPGTPIGPASDVSVGGAASFTDPSTQNPAYVVQPQPGRFVAFSAICTHAGCTVGFSRSDESFVCPCHGSIFNATNGSVLQGPAVRPLLKIGVTEGPDGQLYVSG